jgi:AAA+ ATPase superfamily predicted ATPase
MLGRQKELKLLERFYQSKRGELIVIYGRRRVGKSCLIKNFINKKKNCYFFEGLEKQHQQKQIENFISSLSKQFSDPYLPDMNFDSWHKVFNYITDKITSRKRKVVLVFDEIQWIATGHDELISLIKYYWDNYWCEQNTMLILCGSIASFMVKKIIHSKALYGRISQEILLHGLNPYEALGFFKNKRSLEEILKYYLVFGGIPKYLELIDLSLSFNQNMNKLCFTKDSFMLNEPEKIFYSQFRESRLYLKIAKALANQSLSLVELGKKLNKEKSGSLKQYLSNLEDAQIISQYISFDSKHNTKFKKYKLTDELLCFAYKYIEPYKNEIKNNPNISTKLFEKVCEKHWNPWLGLAFERFIMRNGYYVAERLGLASEIIGFYPLFGRSDKHFQIDLIYKRSDQITSVCEIKYHNKPIDTTIIPEFERKLKLLQNPKGHSIEKILISLYGPSKPLQDSQYFDRYLTLETLCERTL